jgi:hypothetical protein
MNEDEIDNELRCAVCQQPFHEPISSKKCHHTFCKACIIACLNQERRCPVCRAYSDYEHYELVESRALLNQLNRLRVCCDACQARNIQRGDFERHTQNCPNWIIPCIAADIRCTWQGMHNRLANHLKSCPFQPIRPIIQDLQGQIKDLRKKQSFIILVIVLILILIFLVTIWPSSEQNRKTPTTTTTTTTSSSFVEKFRGLFEN